MLILTRIFYKPIMEIILQNRTKIQITVITLLISFGLLLAGYFYYQKEKRNHVSQKFNELQTVSSLKADQLSLWLEERHSEVNFFSANNPYPEIIKSILNENAEKEEDFRNALSRIMTNNRYENIYIVDSLGNIVFSLDTNFTIVDQVTKEYVSEVFENEKIVIKDFYFCQTHQKIHFEIFAPVRDEKQNIIASIVFRINPSDFLYKLIAENPTPGLSKETYIVKKYGDSALILSELRHIDNSKLQVSVPLSKTEVTAVKAVMGYDGILEGIDYRGVNVFSDIRKVEGTDWFIITEIDNKELFAELNKQSAWFFSAIILFILLIAAVISWSYHRRQRNQYKELLEKRLQLFRTQEEFGAILYSIGDGVISTDQVGKVRHMNPVAENLTGWKESEALGKPIEEVFIIENEESRLKVENPVQKVLREGKIVGLANHTVLISRNGHETPISNSGAPIKDNDGKILGTIMVFNDQTEERMRRNLIDIRLKLFEFAIDHNLNETLIKMLDEICVLLKSPIGFIHFFLPDQEKLWLQTWSTRTQKEFCKAPGAGLHYDLNEAGVWADAVRMKKPVIHNDYKSLFVKNGLPEDHAEVTRELVVPVIRGDKVIAVTGIGNKPDDYNEKDVDILSFLADVSWEIAQHKLNENRLRQSEERFAQLFENAPLGYQSLDENGNFLLINQAWTETLGYSKEEVIGKWFGDFIDKREVDSFGERFSAFKKNGKVQAEISMMHKNGTKRILLFDGRIGYRDDGSIERTHCILRDITESKQLEEKLRENERQLSSMVGSLPGFVYRCKYDKDWTMIYISEQCKEITGYDAEDILFNHKLSFNDIIKKEYRDELQKEWAKILANKTSFRKEYEIITANGETKWLLEFGIGVFDKSGNLMFLEGYIENITERKLKDIQLNESERKFRHMFHGHAAVKIIVDPEDARIVDANEAAAEFYGWSVSELSGMKITQIHILPPKEVFKFIREAKKKENGRFEFQHRKANGEIVDIENFNSKVTIGGKEYLYSIIHDITEKKQAEKALLESEEKNRLIMDNSMDAILHTKPDGSILSANKAACNLFGMSEFEICKKGRIGLVDPEDSRLDELLALREKWGFAEGELNFIRKDGTKFISEITSSLFKNSKGELFSSMIIRDISERKKWEQDLLIAKEKAEESDRLKTAFLANMSHEIRTPMNGILGFLYLLNSKDLDDSSRQQYTNVVNISGQRLLNTINDIIEISKIEAGEQEIKNSIFDISEIMQYHIDFFQLQANQKGITLSIAEQISPEQSFVETDKYKLESILTNLVKNALKFTSQGTIKLGNYLENGSLVFYVKDTGCGIPPNKIETIFERFMQVETGLARSHEGSGLGLTIAKGYVNILGGNIWLQSEVGKGSTFYFSIPYKLSSVENYPFPEEEKEIPDQYVKENTILIAEDDDLSYQYLEVILKQKNIRLFRAKNGLEAIQLLKQNPDISLILMDIKMPEMDGLEATREIRKFNKKIPVIAQTAYALSGDKENSIQAGCTGYLTKPIQTTELFSILDNYLDSLVPDNKDLTSNIGKN